MKGPGGSVHFELTFLTVRSNLLKCGQLCGKTGHSVW